jgi:phosphatidylserine/phosphatidylglycerophosphate/cardiolipin synthase-like enzyme
VRKYLLQSVKLRFSFEKLAYVGSANLMHSSKELSLETGLLIEGGAAAQVARLVDGVLRVARTL